MTSKKSMSGEADEYLKERLLECEKLVEQVAKEEYVKTELFRSGIPPIFSPSYNTMDYRWTSDGNTSDDYEKMVRRMIYSVQENWVQCQWELEMWKTTESEKTLVLHARVLYRKQDADLSNRVAYWPRHQ
jgi:hypothetical protein